MNGSFNQRAEGWVLNCTCHLNNTLPATCNKTCDPLSAESPSEIPVYFTWKALMLFQAFYVIIMAIGILGNMLTMYVILHRKSMRRAIHFYTFNLAVTDLLILFFYVPTQMSMIKHQMEWKMGLAMCKINYVVLPVALISSIGTLLAITVDRFRGLVTPFSWRSDSKRKAKMMIPMMWIVSFTLCVPLFMYSKIASYKFSATYTAFYCTEDWPSKQNSDWYWVINFVLVFAIPLVVIVTTQVIMLVTVKRELSDINRLQNQRMIRMVVALVFVFTICTGFQHVFYFIVTFSDINISGPVYGALYGSSNLVVSLQAAVNPIIYGTLRQDFNKAFKSILVLILIKFKLHKKALDGRSSFASRVLSDYFSDADSSKHLSKKYSKVGMLFRKKKEADLTQESQIFFTTPQSSPAPFRMKNQVNNSPQFHFYFDSPRVSMNNELLIGKSGRYDVPSTLPATLRTASNASNTTSLLLNSPDISKHTNNNNNTVEREISSNELHTDEILGSFSTSELSYLTSRLKESKETSL